MRFLRIRAMRSYASLISLQFFEKFTLHCDRTKSSPSAIIFFCCTLVTRPEPNPNHFLHSQFAFQVCGEFYSSLRYVKCCSFHSSIEEERRLLRFSGMAHKHNGDVIAKPERYFSHCFRFSFFILNFLSHLSCQQQQHIRIESAEKKRNKTVENRPKNVFDSFETVATPKKTPSHFRTRKSRD